MENHHKSVFVLLVASLFFVQCFITIAIAQGAGEDNQHSGDSNHSGIEEEECGNYSIEWFIHQYDLRILSLPYLHIGVNVSLADVASSSRPQADFKKLLNSNPPERLSMEEVCSEHNIHPQQNNIVCPWTYTCTYDPHRFPAYVFKAECTNNQRYELTRTNHGTTSWVTHPCQEVYYPIPMLYYTGCNPLTNKQSWEWVQERVPVACA